MSCSWKPLGRGVATVALALVALVVRGAEPTPAPLPPKDAARTMRVPEGFRVTVYASEPELVQPVGFCIDDRGRLMVAEALNYGQWQPTGSDRIVIFNDADGDGQAESRKIFYEGFNYITGIEVGFGGVWVLSPPTLYFIPDRDRDDRPDGPPEPVFDGFGYKESRHNLANGFTWGPDGWLYAGHGRTSPSDVGRPGDPAEKRIHCDGGVYRIHPTRRVFENFADGTTNPWGVDFDDFGQCFVSNCVNPHLFHMIPGGHYEPWRNRPSSLYAYERLPTIADHLHYPSGKPSAMRGETAETLAMGGGHAHCGTLVYLGDRFPSQYRNTVLMCNVHGRRVNHDLLVPRGSGYIARHGRDFLVAEDPWFMGVTLRTGPDGNVFISDWSDTGECHTYKPQKHTGRIYKVSYGPNQPVPGDLATCTDLELVERQLHLNDWHVRHARRLLQERASQAGWDGSTARQRLDEILDHHADVTRRLRALWALHVVGGLPDERLAKLLADGHEQIRAWAVRLLCEDRLPPPEALSEMKRLAREDKSPVVRLSLAAELQRLPLEQRWEIADELVRHDEDAEDPNLPLMNWYAVEPLVPREPARALGLARAAQIPLVRQYLARRLVEHAIVQRAPAVFTQLVQTIGDQPVEAQRDLLAGAHAGTSGSKRLAMPAGWSELYVRLARSSNPQVRENSHALALVFGDPQAITVLRSIAVDGRAEADERRRALETLVEQRVPELDKLLLTSLSDPVLRQVSLRGLASYQAASTAERILTLYPQLSAAEKLDAVATLAARKDSALALLDAVEAKSVPRLDVSAFIARQMHARGDRELNQRLKQVWGEVRETNPQKQKQLERFKSLITPVALTNADPERGRALYTKMCGQCHTLYGEGGKIGPDLTGTNRSNLDYLFGNIVDPAAEIGQDFRMSIVTMLDGRVLSGIVVERLPNRLVLQTATERLVLSPEDVETTQESKLSLMPEGQLDQLTSQQIRDLVRYLTNPGTK